MGARISIIAAVVVIAVGIAVFSLFPANKADGSGSLKDSSRTGDAAQAAASSEDTPEASSEGSGAEYLKRGIELLEKNSLEEALAELLEAARLEPRNGQVRYRLGHAYHKKAQPDEAIREYELAIRYDPSQALAHGQLGELLAQKGDADGAIASYRQALALEPENAVLHNNLATVLNAKGEFDQALAEIEAALKIEPDNTDFMNNAGTMLKNKGDLRSALEWFTKACDAGNQTACSHQREVTALIR